mmetsp:Transcript_47945/g.104518  ORF Transcript_47945/g.104518 Transcript_47945/m.104518 type:complete len:226 (-) Transcript_47945:1497-2174(-)
MDWTVELQHSGPQQLDQQPHRAVLRQLCAPRPRRPALPHRLPLRDPRPLPGQRVQPPSPAPGLRRRQLLEPATDDLQLRGRLGCTRRRLDYAAYPGLAGFLRPVRRAHLHRVDPRLKRASLRRQQHRKPADLHHLRLLDGQLLLALHRLDALRGRLHHQRQSALREPRALLGRRLHGQLERSQQQLLDLAAAVQLGQLQLDRNRVRSVRVLDASQRHRLLARAAD